MFMTLSQQHI